MKEYNINIITLLAVTIGTGTISRKQRRETLRRIAKDEGMSVETVTNLMKEAQKCFVELTQNKVPNDETIQNDELNE